MFIQGSLWQINWQITFLGKVRSQAFFFSFLFSVFHSVSIFHVDAKSKCHLARHFSISALLITEILNCIVLTSVLVHDYESSFKAFFLKHQILLDRLVPKATYARHP